MEFINVNRANTALNSTGVETPLEDPSRTEYTKPYVQALETDVKGKVYYKRCSERCQRRWSIQSRKEQEKRKKLLQNLLSYVRGELVEMQIQPKRLLCFHPAPLGGDLIEKWSILRQCGLHLDGLV